VRGCLFVLVVAGAFLVGIVWFGGPPIAGAVIEANLAGSGFRADRLAVAVAADPPLTLAVGRADRVTIDADGVRWNGLVAGSMSLVLGGMDLIGRTAATVEGRFDDVDLGGVGGPPLVAMIEIEGPASAAETTIRLAGTSVAAAAIAAFTSVLGVGPDSAELRPPNIIRLAAAGLTLDAELELSSDGAIVAVSSLGTVRVFQPDPAIPVRLTGLSVADGRLVLIGTLDVAALLR
jgi:hypothetical protein